MEDLKAYIDSGILELYVLGAASADEVFQVEQMAAKHEEIRDEIRAIEAAMEQYASSNAIEPREEVRNRVLNSLVVNLGDDRTFGNTANVVPIQSPAKPRVNFYKYAFAACLLLLLVSVAALITLYGRLRQSNELVSSLQLENQKFSNRVNLMDEQLDVFRDPSFKFVQLKGTKMAPASAMTVAWSAAKSKVMIDMHGMKLNPNDNQHQYQLWAIVGGKPVDLGVFDTPHDPSAGMKEMKPVEEPQAFAVTLEPKGGSINPTMDQMVVISNI